MAHRRSVKFAMSLPAELFESVEKARKRSGKSRSMVVQEALRRWLHLQQHVLLVREYEAGYRRDPEDEKEIRVAEAAASALPEDDW